MRCTRVVLFIFLGFLLFGAVFATANNLSSQKTIENRPRNQISILSQPTPTVSNDILIFYDGSNRLLGFTATRLYFLLRSAFPNVGMRSVNSLEELETGLYECPYIALLIFNSSLDGVYIGENIYDWKEFVNVIGIFDDIEFIFAMGNTHMLESYSRTNWHYKVYDYVGLTPIEIYAAWEVAEILPEVDSNYEGISQRLKMLTAGYFVENINKAFEDSVVPTVRLGVSNPEIHEALRQKYLAMHPNTLNIRVVSTENSVYDKPAFIVNKVDTYDADEYLDFMNIPQLSGLIGPIGDFIDKILYFLINEEDVKVIQIAKDLVESVVDIFSAIKEFIGDPSDLGASSLLRGFLNVLESEFPYISNYTKYFDLFVDGLFALRGDISSILNFVETLIPEILPSGAPHLSDLINILKNTVFNIPDDIFSIIGSISDDKISVLINWVLSQLTNLTINKLLESVQSYISYGESLYNNITSILNLVTSLLTIRNITTFIDQLYNIFVNKLKIFQSEDAINTINKIKTTTGLILNFLEKTDVNMGNLIIDMVLSYIPSEYISNIESMADELLERMDQAIKDAESDIDAFISDLETILNNYITTANEEINKGKEIIKDTLTLVTAVMNPEFNVEYVDNVFKIIDNVLENFLGTSPNIKQKLLALINATIYPYATVMQSSRILKAFFGEIDYTEDLKSYMINVVLDGVKVILEEIEGSDVVNQIWSYVESGIRVVNSIYYLLSEIKDRPYEGIYTAFMMATGYSLVDLFDTLSIGNLTKIFEAILPDLMGLDRTPSVSEAIDMVLEALGVSDSDIINTVKTVLSFVLDIRDVLRNGIKWVMNKVLDWLAGKISDFVSDLINDITAEARKYKLLELDGDMNIGMGGLDFLTFSYYICVDPGLEIDSDGLARDIKDVVVKGKFYDLSNPIETFWKLLKRIYIAPTFEAEFKLKSMFSDDSGLMIKIFDLFGFEMNFEGEARFKLKLFQLSLGNFEANDFFELEEWYLKFSLQVEKKITILDIFFGGSTPGVLNEVAEYIGLDSIYIKISIGIGVEIALGSGATVTGDISTLAVEITIGGSLHVGLDLLIVELSLDASLEVIFKFTQDITNPDTPLKFTFNINYSIKASIDFPWPAGGFSIGDSGNLYHFEYPNPVNKSTDFAGGWDADNDGLPDDYELSTFGFAPNREDTDMDGLPDNVELNSIGTDPLDPDTDGDGLNDYDEVYKYVTDPFKRDTDNDRLSDYEEVILYHTDPNEIDTDGDGLDDHFEVTHKWDISNVTISITGVQIGNEIYYDHTDPLNPDTDGDGLLDGEEGPMGGYYGDAVWDFAKETGATPIIFNYGYTHPLDNDTDDDSFLQEADGDIAQPKVFLMSMTDKEEIDGITVTIIEDGEPVRKTFRTSPVSPDTDCDTVGGIFLNSDGYELSRDPPSDPLDYDSDDDGLADGAEGVLDPLSNKTDRNDPDTDADGLGDLQDIILGLDPRNPDSDYDLVSDGDEFLKYGTNPRMEDSDLDGLTDGEELFFYHTNPMLKDSDNDGLSDGEEVLIYYTNPMDEDTDNDGLSDFEEILIYNTNPFVPDSDYDGLLDGYEVNVTLTDPLDWDSDDDSITYPNEYGVMTWPMGDGEEVLIYGTDPLVSDTDRDGISDSLELYLGSGLIPDFEPINLNPLDNDTDGDGLLDGAELRVSVVPDIIYPYVSYNLSYPFGSKPDVYDTDGDGINDYLEVQNVSEMPYITLANDSDTDDDGLTDYEEWAEHGTDPTYFDTDFDNISDYDEIHGVDLEEYNVSTTSFKPLTVVILDPLDNDTDNDYLPDGYELLVTKTNPKDGDQNKNELPDGFEFDTDNDGLSDGEELFIIGTVRVPNGGPLNPDSDNDGISDGEEVKTYGTDPTKADTDGDGYSDGAEVAAGTDPSEWTSEEDYEEAISLKLGGNIIVILTPYGQVYDTTIDVRVVNATTLTSVWFRYRLEGGNYSENISMTYDPASKQWVYSEIVWEYGTYEIEAYGLTTTGKIVSYKSQFTIGELPKPAKPNTLMWIGIGVAVGFGVCLFALFILPRILKKRG